MEHFAMHISFTFPASLFFSSSHLVVHVEDVAGLRTSYVIEDELGYVRGFLLHHYSERNLGPALTGALRSYCDAPAAPILQVRSVVESSTAKIRTSYEGDLPWPSSSRG